MSGRGPRATLVDLSRYPSELSWLADELPYLFEGSNYRSSPALDGRFEPLRLIGRGAISIVIAAHDREHGREVALQFLRLRDDIPGHVRRIRRAVADLDHPNVVRVHDVLDARDHVVIVMELLRGRKMTEWLKEGPSWYAKARVFTLSALGLAAIHRVGHVHCDFTPESVLIESVWTAHGQLRLIDLGMIRPVGSTAMMGSPIYMAPEVLSAAPVDARTDQFSFCVAFFRAFYGTNPFAGDTLLQVCQALAAGDIVRPPPLPDVPEPLFAVLARGLSADPAARWPDMHALLAAFEATTFAGRTPPPPENAGPGPATGVAAALVLAGVLARACG